MKKLVAFMLLTFISMSHAYAGSMLLLKVGSGGAGGAISPTGFILADTGSVLLVNVGSKFLVQ